MAVKDALAGLLQLEQQAFKAQSSLELHYSAVNDIRAMVEADQVVLLQSFSRNNFKVIASADLSVVDRTAPMMAWLERLVAEYHASLVAPAQVSAEVVALESSHFSEATRADWLEFMPAHLLWVPIVLSGPQQVSLGGLVLSKQTPWSAKDKALLHHYAQALAVSWWAHQKCRWRRGVVSYLKRKWLMRAMVVGLIALMFVPVRLSVLSPAEVVAKHPAIITAPIAGVVKEIAVTPNQRVNSGDLLVLLDEVLLQSEYQVAQRALELAQSQLRTIEQAGFVDARQRSRLAELQTEVRLKTAELDYARLRYEKTTLLAPEAGVVIINDPLQWRGRPVPQGEPILQIADPTQVQLRILVPVADAMVLHSGAEVRMFFDSDPLNAWSGRVLRSTYEPELTPEGFMAYRVTASLENDANQAQSWPRIGLRGTAKVYGEPVTLFYYLFRRPITFVRQRLGW